MIEINTRRSRIATYAGSNWMYLSIRIVDLRLSSADNLYTNDTTGIFNVLTVREDGWHAAADIRDHMQTKLANDYCTY